MSDVIPIPKQALELVERMKASDAINTMKLENMLLKHLLATLDPEHDYVFDREKQELRRVKHGENQVQSSNRKEAPEGPTGAPGGETRGFNVNDRRAFVGQAPENPNPVKEEI